jgi:hypothetical protein
VCSRTDVNFRLDFDVWGERWVVEEAQGAGGWFGAVAVGEVF